MKPVDIIITLYVPTVETLKLARRCILSVLLRTDSPYRLLLVDDKSPLPEIRDFVRRIEKRFINKNIVVVFNEHNLGFVKTANFAMAYGDVEGHDVVMLNNDTEVTSGWLKRMVSVAYKDRKIATVTPLSNNATIASVPLMYADNLIPAAYSCEDMARLIRSVSPGLAPEIPTGHGYCLFVKRSVLREVGLFDTVAFGKGYGEENDLCCRCLEHGYCHILDDTTFVYHKGEASFQGSRDMVTVKAFQTLINRYPFFKDVVVAFESNDPIRLTREAIGRHLQEPPRPTLDEASELRILFLNFAGGPFNGLRTYTRDVISGMGDTAKVFVLESDGFDLSLKDGSGIQVFYTRLQERLNWNGIFTNVAYKRILTFLVRHLGFDVIHVNCFEGHTFDVLDIAEEAQIPVTYTAHDLELICPTHFLVSPEGTLCHMCSHEEEHQNCLERNGHLMSGRGSSAQLLRFRNYVVREAIPRLSKVICPSADARERLTKMYPSIASKIETIPHGVDGRPIPMPKRTRGDSPLRVATVGAMHDLKGLKLLRQIVQATESDSLEFHHFGPTADTVERILYHGAYKPAELAALLQKHSIDLVLMLSLLPETFGYTLSEVAILGVPVIAHEVGAIPQRVREHQLGWVVPYSDSAAYVRLLRELGTNRKMLDAAKSSMRVETIVRTKEMAIRYRALYRSLAQTARASKDRATVESSERFLRITAFTNQVRIDELAGAKRHYEILANDLAQQLHSVRERCHIIENSIPVRIGRAVKRIPWIARVLRSVVRPVLGTA